MGQSNIFYNCRDFNTEKDKLLFDVSSAENTQKYEREQIPMEKNTLCIQENTQEEEK